MLGLLGQIGPTCLLMTKEWNWDCVSDSGTGCIKTSQSTSLNNIIMKYSKQIIFLLVNNYCLVYKPKINVRLNTSCRSNKLEIWNA